MRLIDPPFTFQAHESHITSLVFFSEDQGLLTAGMDNLVHYWSLPSWQRKRTFTGHHKSVNSLALTPDGGYLITASSDSTVRVWDVESGEEIRTLGIRGSRAWLSADGRYLAALDNPWLSIMQMEQDEVISRYKPFPKRTTALAFSPNRDRLALGGQGDDILVYCLPGLSLDETIAGAHAGYVLSLAFSPDGERLISTGLEKRLRFWQSDGWKALGEVTLENQGVQSLAFSHSGSYLAVASDHRVSLIDADSMQIAQTVDLNPKGVYCLAFSPGDRWLACGAADKHVRIWDLSK